MVVEESQSRECQIHCRPKLLSGRLLRLLEGLRVLEGHVQETEK